MNDRDGRDDDVLRRFLQAVENVRAERGGVPTPEIRLRIASELGLTPAELAAARAEGEQDLARGEGFLRHELWDDAIRSLGEADALLPADLRVMTALAAAHHGRWRRDGSAMDQARARALAGACVELDPQHEPSFRMLRELDSGRAPAPKRRWRRRLLLAAALTLVAGAAAALVWTFTGPRCPNGDSYCALPVEVSVDPALAADLPGLTIEHKARTIWRSIWRRQATLHLGGRLTHQGPTELQLLRPAVRLLDAQGGELERRQLDLHHAYEPELRAGDTRPFSWSSAIPAATHRAELVAGERKTAPAPAAYEAAAPIELTFAFPPPAQLRLAAAYRRRTGRRQGEATTLELDLELVNRGSAAIRNLEFEIQAIGPDQAPLGRPEHRTFLSQHAASFEPGERRVQRFSLTFPQTPVAERWVVVRID